eukprot:CAMPEP_0195525498 /NCGR_PEP_ID=MMETSP0794_2-20130614/25987_1 /TAXON_ID=515487 /ORGANISM="Stephanopyxis turris, Strain CCMP 815" /LENGTH=81 /DNA_ID=CAMNT_0040655977 /DNA_START=67 /DNA_END=312 /DNA_ORIENTATION=+
MVLRLIARAVAPNLERDLARSIGKEFKGISDTLSSLGPQIYSYQPQAAVVGGAFGRSGAMQSPERLVRVQRPSSSNGLFHE